MKKVLIVGLMMVAGIAHAWDMDKLYKADPKIYNIFVSKTGNRIAFMCSYMDHVTVNGQGYFVQRKGPIGIQGGPNLSMPELVAAAQKECNKDGYNFEILAAGN